LLLRLLPNPSCGNSRKNLNLTISRHGRTANSSHKMIMAPQRTPQCGASHADSRKRIQRIAKSCHWLTTTYT